MEWVSISGGKKTATAIIATFYDWLHIIVTTDLGNDETELYLGQSYRCQCPVALRRQVGDQYPWHDITQIMIFFFEKSCLPLSFPYRMVITDAYTLNSNMMPDLVTQGPRIFVWIPVLTMSASELNTTCMWSWPSHDMTDIEEIYQYYIIKSSA